MKTKFLFKLSPALLLYSGLSLAILPVTVIYDNGTTNFTNDTSGSANYVVSVGNIPYSMPLTFNSNPNSSSGLTTVQVSSGVSLCPGVNIVCSHGTFSLGSNQSCCLEFSLASSSAGYFNLQPSISTIPAAYSYQAKSATTVAVSEHGGTTSITPLTVTSALTLSVNCTSAGGGCVYSNAALTGNARKITVTNTSTTDTTTPLVITPSNLPVGTGITTDTCAGATLAPQTTCTITITPGKIASSNCTSGTQPSPGTVTISGSSVPNAVSSNILVLSYGCQYQGGFLYSVNDSYNDYPATSSIGGKVASLVNQGTALWSSNGTASGVSEDIVPYVSEGSTASDSWGTAFTIFFQTYNNESTYPYPPSDAFPVCAGAIDGQCNSGNIITLYSTYNTGYGIGSSPYTLSAGPTNPLYYAAGLCTATINTYSDWYLPAICEMNTINDSLNCPAGTQSMLTSLPFLVGNSTTCNLPEGPPAGTDCLIATYWSSTQVAALTQYGAWASYFAISGSMQEASQKYGPNGVRCSRALTP